MPSSSEPTSAWPGTSTRCSPGWRPALAGGSLDILVNNAGGALGTGSIEETTPEEFDRLIALNMRTPFFIIQRALPLFRDGGRIINISSADARIAITRELAYSMAKGAINVLSRTLAHAAEGQPAEPVMGQAHS